MTIKEAILKTLEDIAGLATYNEVYTHIVSRGYYDFKEAKTPNSTVSALLGDFIRLEDSRVKRLKRSGAYLYYLTKNEKNIGIDELSGEVKIHESKVEKTQHAKSYAERDLHMLLSSYLKNTDTYSKTIYHEQSNGKESNQIWTHPDMVGIKFLNLQTTASQNFLKSINRVDTFKMSSYELKREINSDSELKRAFFQAVSNSSWANYGYLAAFEFSDGLAEEMARLNQSFGIGIIKINPNPYQSKILYPSTYRDLDFKTIDKLCKMNDKFNKFIEQTEKLLTASDKYVSGAAKELDEFCDSYFYNDSEIEKYCQNKWIPWNPEC